MQLIRNLTCALVTVLTSMQPALGDIIKMNGATTVLNVVVKPTQAAAERRTGHQLQLVGNATGKGLIDLVNGHADVAMVSEPMDIALDAVVAAGGEIKPDRLVFRIVKNDEIVFTVNDTNPVKNLSIEQLRAIHAGELSNWKQLGGRDLPIVVYSDAVTGGTRAMVKRIVLGGAPYGPNVKAQTSVKRAAEAVGLDEAGIAGVGRGFVDPARAKIVKTPRIERPLGFVTVGAPKPAVRAMIDAIAEELKRK